MMIKHLSHSGFMVDITPWRLFFDPITPLETSDQTLFFISHSHHDHFRKSILPQANQYINYIVSKDVHLTQSSHIYTLAPYERLNIQDIDIRAYGTTDLGNSYLVSVNNMTFFHSGDLNWWHWERMSPDELKLEEINFKNELKQLQGKKINFAFIPVDPRLNKFAYLAMNYFIDLLKPQYVIPMHSFGNYAFYKDLKENLKLNGTTLINVLEENEMIYQSASVTR
ncbi:MAG: MBL fold metallo-hydrolase [Eubacteriales bacterium]